MTIDDFVQAMQDASGVDLQRFKRWYHQAGTPTVTVSDRYDAAARRYTLTLKQHTPPTPGQPDKQPLVIPVAMGLLGPAGEELPTRLAGEAQAQSGHARACCWNPREQDFVFEEVPAPPVPSLLRGFSAPVRLAGVPQERMRFLAAHDTDPVRPLGCRPAIRHRAAAGADRGLAARRNAFRPIPALLDGLAATLALGETGDAAFAAEALACPSETFLADQMEVADIDGIHAVREAMRSAIGTALRPALRGPTTGWRMPATTASTERRSAGGRCAICVSPIWWPRAMARACGWPRRSSMPDAT